MAYPTASLGGVDLPPQFSYSPASPKKRHTTVQTANGVRIHQAPSIVPGDSIIPFSVPEATQAEWAEIQNFFIAQEGNDLVFVGYWGDSHTVRFLNFDSPRVIGRRFQLSGSLQILSTTSWGTQGA